MWRRWWWIGCVAWLLAGPARATTCGPTANGSTNNGTGWCPNAASSCYNQNSDCTTTTGGVVTQIHLWVHTAVNATHIECGLYTRSGNQITLISGCTTASTTITGTADTRYDMNVTGSCSVTASTSYTIGCLTDSNSVAFSYGSTATSSKYGNVGSYTLTGCASCNSGLQQGPLSAYFEYTDNTPTATRTSTATATVTNTGVAATATPTVTPTATPTRTPARGGPQVIEEPPVPGPMPEAVEAPSFPGQVPMLIDDETKQFPPGNLSLIDSTPSRTSNVGTATATATGSTPTATATNTLTPTITPVPTYGATPPAILAVVALVAPSGAGYNKTQLTVTGSKFGITGTRSVELFHDGTSTIVASGDAGVTAWFDDYIELTLSTRTTALSATVTRDGVTSTAVTAEVYEWTAHHPAGFLVASNVLEVDDNGIIWLQPEFTTGFISYDPVADTWGAYPIPVPTVSAVGFCSGPDVERACTGTGGGTCPAGELCIHPGNIFAAESQMSLMGEDVHVTPDGMVWTGYGGYSGYLGPWPNHSIIMRYDPTTGNKRVYNLPGENNSIKGMAWDATRNLWWVGQQGGIIAFDPDTTPWTNPAFDFGSSNDDLWCADITRPIDGCYRFYAQDNIANPVETGLVKMAPDGTVWWTMFGSGCWSDPTWPYPHVLGHLDPDTGVIEQYPIPVEGCQTGLEFDTNGDVYFTDFRRNWMMKLAYSNVGISGCMELDENGQNPCFVINPMPHVNPLGDEEFLSIFGVTATRLWWAIWQGVATREQGFIGWIDRATNQYVRFPYPHDLPGTSGYDMTSYCPAWFQRLVNGDIWTADFYNGGLVRYLFRGATPPPATYTPTGVATATVTATPTVTPTATPAGPLVAIVPSGAVAVLEGLGDLQVCAATPAPAATPGAPYLCVDAAGSPRGIAPVPFGSSAVVPDLGTGPLVRCQPGDASVAFLCRTTPTPGTVRVKIGHTGKSLAFDATGDYAVCGATSPYYLCASQ